MVDALWRRRDLDPIDLDVSSLFERQVGLDAAIVLVRTDEDFVALVPVHAHGKDIHSLGRAAGVGDLFGCGSDELGEELPVRVKLIAP